MRPTSPVPSLAVPLPRRLLPPPPPPHRGAPSSCSKEWTAAGRRRSAPGSSRASRRAGWVEGRRGMAYSAFSSSAATTSKRGALVQSLFQLLLLLSPSPPTSHHPESKQNKNKKRRQIKAEMWRFPDRTTEIGTMINAYLARSKELDDAAVHLLFSANRWEKRAELLRELPRGRRSSATGTPSAASRSPRQKRRQGWASTGAGPRTRGCRPPTPCSIWTWTPPRPRSAAGLVRRGTRAARCSRSVREAFGEIAAFVDGRCTRWLRVDASGSVEEVGERVGAAARASVEAAARRAGCR